MNHRRQPSPAFTRTELIVVLAVLAAVFLLIVPALNVRRVKQYRALCARNLQMIGVGMNAYQSDNKGCLPTIYKNRYGLWDLALVTGRYVPGESVFQCPADRMDRISSGFRRSYSYSINTHPERFWIGGSRLPCRYFPEPGNVAVLVEHVTIQNRFAEDENNCCGGPDSVQSQHTVIRPSETRPPSNYLFMDGHVAWADTPQSNWFPVPPADAPWRPCP